MLVCFSAKLNSILSAGIARGVGGQTLVVAEATTAVVATGQDSLFAVRLLRDRAIAVHMGSNALRGHGESAPSEHAMRILTLRSPSVAQGQWRRGSRMGLRGAVDAQGLAPGCAGARARRRPCQQLGCPSSRGLSPRSAGRPGPGQARRALPLGGAACDGTSGRAEAATGAIWWALHGLRCSSGAYAHI